MPCHRIEANGTIDASAELAYAIIADYRDGHPQILPRPPFASLEVEQGGIGAGTIIRFQMRTLGSLRTFRASITEPEPGRTLVESDEAGNFVTTYTVERVGPNKARVTVATDMAVRGGLLGRFERYVVTRILSPVYAREIKQLETVARTRAAEAI